MLLPRSSNTVSLLNSRHFYCSPRQPRSCKLSGSTDPYSIARTISERGRMAITAQAVVNRIQKKFGPGWMPTPVDAFMAGDPGIEVTGIVTTYAPTLEVLKKAVASGKNMIISRENPYWVRTNAWGGGTQFQGLQSNWTNGQDFIRQEPGAADNDPTFLAKKEYIDSTSW